MSLKFRAGGYNWSVGEGFPPMGSVELSTPTFVEALRGANSRLPRYTDRELASWIVARLTFLTSGALLVEGDVFSHDTNEFGYKLKMTDESKVTVAHGAIVIHADRIYFASVNAMIDDFQSVVANLLTESPDELAACEVRVQEPETRRYRSYGWNGHSFLT